MFSVTTDKTEEKDFLDIRDFLHRAVIHRASDIHVKVRSRIMARIHGLLLPFSDFVLDEKLARQVVYSTMREDQIRRFEENLELDYSYEASGIGRFRANACIQQGTVAASFRHVPSSIPTIEELHLPAICARLAHLPRGLILVCGPTGCGKSTTIAALIDHINSTRSCRIVTIEDPIEFIYEERKAMIIQREVYRDTKAFPTALRETLRQDPNVIVVGEMRDLDTMALALTAAETGHLVIATLHSQGASQNIDRIIDVFPPSQQEQIRYQMSNTIQAVITQLLLRTAKGDARLPAVEVMVATHSIRNLIRESKTHQIKSVMQTSSRSGMQTMDQALAEMVATGDVLLEEALTMSESHEDMRNYLERFRAPKAVTRASAKPHRT